MSAEPIGPEAEAVEPEAEEEMILERLIAVKALREERRRLESGGPGVAEADVTIPAGWLDLLGRGMAMLLQEADATAAGELPETGDLEHIERARCLARAIQAARPGHEYLVSPHYHEELCEGLRGALIIQKHAAQCLSDHSPLGARFIADVQLVAIYQFMCVLEDVIDQRS